MQDIAGALERALAALSFTGRQANQVTELLAAAVADWGTAQGWQVYRKARSVFPLPPPYSDRFSWVDVAFAREGEQPVVVEIDRSDRQRTLEKLLAEAAAGRIAIWVRWGEGPFATPAPPVQLVPVIVETRAGRYSSPGPVKPAPEHSTFDPGEADQMDLF